MFNIVAPDTIHSGDATDAYFHRTEEALAAADHNPHVVAEVTADQRPDGTHEVFAGLNDAARLLDGLPITVEALREGQLFDGGPVMRIRGHYRDFARYETALLGFLSHASGIATAALECRRAAPDTTILSFGARHVNPALGIMIERSAFIGGCDGFSNVAAADHLPSNATGTMPHALLLAFGRDGRTDAFEAFDAGVPDDVPRIALCDTYSDETEEVRAALDTFGDDLDGVRLDTTSSRRGDFRHIIEEVQWTLDDCNRSDVDIYVSGGLGPADIRELRDVVDGFGIGGYISNADPVDFGLDIVEVDGEPISKRGKLGGVKDVYEYPDGRREIGRTSDPHPGATKLLRPLIEDGEIVRKFAVEKAATLAQIDADDRDLNTATRTPDTADHSA